MKIIQFKCNICDDVYSYKEAVSQKLLKAIYFVGNKKFEIRDLNAECDHHVCNNCLDQFKKQL